MAGHSKWASIKHKKKAVDAKRGQLFTKLSRAITVAAREGGGDPDANPSLGLAVQKARDASMPKDNIERAIAKGTGADSEADAYEAVLYEGYGPGAVALTMDGDVWEIVTGPADLAAVRAALEEAGVELESAELVQRATTRTPVEEDRVGSLMRLIEALEDHDDVQAVHANFDVDAEVLERVAAV